MYFFLRKDLTVTKAEVQRHNHSLLQPWPPGLNQSSYLSLWSLEDYGHVPPYSANLQNNFVEMGSHHVALAGLEFLGSTDPPTSVSWSAGITGVSHHTWPIVNLISQYRTQHSTCVFNDKNIFWEM